MSYCILFYLPSAQVTSKPSVFSDRSLHRHQFVLSVAIWTKTQNGNGSISWKLKPSSVPSSGHQHCKQHPYSLNHACRLSRRTGAFQRREALVFIRIQQHGVHLEVISANSWAARFFRLFLCEICQTWRPGKPENSWYSATLAECWDPDLQVAGPVSHTLVVLSWLFLLDWRFARSQKKSPFYCVEKSETIKGWINGQFQSAESHIQRLCNKNMVPRCVVL